MIPVLRGLSLSLFRTREHVQTRFLHSLVLSFPYTIGINLFSIISLFFKHFDANACLCLVGFSDAAPLFAPATPLWV